MSQTANKRPRDYASLQSHLAEERTVLANERSLLAYIRTAVAFGGAGGGVIFLAGNETAHAFGWAMIGVAAITVAFGFWRFRQIQRLVKKMAQEKENDD